MRRPDTTSPASSRTQKIAATQLSNYDKERTENLMRNNRIMQELGLKTLAGILNDTIHHNNKTKQANNKTRKGEDSGSDYDPEDDKGSERDEIDDNSLEDKEVLMEDRCTSTKSTSSKPSKMPPGARPVKRVLPPAETTQVARFTRFKSKQLPLAHDDEDRSKVREEVCTQRPTRNNSNLVESSQPRSDDVTGSIMYDVEQSEDVLVEFKQHTPLDDDARPQTPKRGRGHKPTMGKGLDKLSRGMGTKMPIKVVEGMRRPEEPMQAAKLASECGVAIRQQVPILTHYKEYKKEVNKKHFREFLGTVAGRFTLNTNDKVMIDACTDMFKGGQQQVRYRMKKHYFDGVPADKVPTKSPVSCMSDNEWNDLVVKWSSQKNKEICEKNKQNRAKVKLQQKTGSRSYVAHCYSLKDKYKDQEPNAIDLFKECHSSKKNGFSEPVKRTIAEMEAMTDQPAEEGQEPKSSTQIVSNVLSQFSGTSKFLRNVGFQSGSQKTSTPATAAHAQQLERALQCERDKNAALEETVQSQQQELDALKKSTEEAEAARKKQEEEMEQVKKKQDETDAILHRLLSISQVQSSS